VLCVWQQSKLEWAAAEGIAGTIHVPAGKSLL
jgi:hypothetical protein